MFRTVFRSARRRSRPSLQFRPTIEALESRWVPAAFGFSNGATTNLIAVASHPETTTSSNDEHETGDDFITTTGTTIQTATFVGLIPTGVALSSISDVHLEIYRVFPFDSNVARTTGSPTFATSQVPTRVNSPADVSFEERDSGSGDFTFTVSVLSSSFTVENSVITGINPKPNQTTGGEGAKTGQEIQIKVTFKNPFQLPADHYFFVPQVQLSGETAFPFLWVSATRPNTSISPDLQAWTRDSALEPDWLRVGTDIVGGTTPPTFNMSFSLTGVTNQSIEFVEALYTDFLGRDASEAELDSWVKLLPTIGQAGVANALIRSPEALTKLVDGFYVQFLGRSAAAGEANGFVAEMQRGATEEQVIAQLLGSAEFAAHANKLIGGTDANANYVQALFKLLLNRTGSSSNVATFENALPTIGRAGVATLFLNTQEYRNDVITTYYTTLLKRKTAPTPAEIAPFVNSRLDLLTIEVLIVSSAEFFNNA